MGGPIKKSHKFLKIFQIELEIEKSFKFMK